MTRSSFSIGQSVPMDKYVTTLKSVLVGGSTPTEQESKMGFSPGAMAGGYWLFILAPQERIALGQFEFRGYTHFSDGIPKGESQNVHDTLRNSYSGHKIDQDNWKRIQREAVERLNRDGLDRLCKLIFDKPDQMDYPPGRGVVQYTLTAKKSFIAAAFVGPTQKLVGLGGISVGVTAA